MTELSICIPVFRQSAQAIDSVMQMLLNERAGFEILVADFSGDADQALARLAADRDDPRLRVITPEGGAGSESACWNQMIAQAKGEWITIIGESDYADPEICELIRVTLSRVPDADALSWGRAEFVPPAAREPLETARVPAGSKLLLPEQAEMMRRLFYWEGASDRPDCFFSAWHGAVRRDLLDKISEAFSGVYFEQPSPQIDNLCKVVLLAKRMVFWERPLSVQCTLPVSATKRHETGETAVAEGFPFSADTGGAAAIALQIEVFKKRYDIVLDGWEDNFIAACANDCEKAASGEEFHARKAAYAQAITSWRGKRALAGFKPEFRRKPKLPRFRGVKDQVLHFDMSMDATSDAAGFYRLINAMTFPVNLLDDKLA
ncbi:glycosyltransferase family 2 protein [Hoeflea sp.]|uniref:glycosyltransferase family 2 protein n=1 Tax=Hoeflea sp. TaxID=1940281 RepID=UPI003A8E737B